MTKPFYDRLRDYYINVAKVLRGESNASSVFPNPTDVGVTREGIYAEFLRQHLPSKCNVFFGGFVFNRSGKESSQLDIIVTSDSSPRFQFGSYGSTNKSFAAVDGVIAIASSKSMLNRDGLYDALGGIATIPPVTPLTNYMRIVEINGHEDWPYKIIFALDGVNDDTLLAHLASFYENNSDIPISRRPNIIHVAGKYVVLRVDENHVLREIGDERIKELPPNEYIVIRNNPDLSGIAYVLSELHDISILEGHINNRYVYLLQGVLGAFAGRENENL